MPKSTDLHCLELAAMRTAWSFQAAIVAGLSFILLIQTLDITYAYRRFDSVSEVIVSTLRHFVAALLAAAIV